MPRRFLPLLMLIAVLGSGTAASDQNSPRLDDLFNQLKRIETPAEAAPIERQIWLLWSLPDDRLASDPFAQGVILMNEGDLAGARAKFDRVVEVAPDFAEGWNKRATVAYFLGDLDASIHDIRKTIALEPRHFGALSGLAMIFTDLGKAEAALDVLVQVKEIYPGMPGLDARMAALREAIANKKT